MAIRVEKPAFNVREKLTELDSASIPYERMPKRICSSGRS